MLILIGKKARQILFVERPTTMRTHAAQIAFPGGAADPEDADLAATALREATEETGVDPSGIEILGQLPPAHVDVSGFDVTAVVGWWARPSPVGAVDVREVASVLVVPVARLVDPANRAQVHHPSGYTGPAFVDRRPPDLGPDRPPARRRTRSRRVAAAVGPRAADGDPRPLSDRTARPWRTRCPLMTLVRPAP